MGGAASAAAAAAAALVTRGAASAVVGPPGKIWPFGLLCLFFAAALDAGFMAALADRAVALVEISRGSLLMHAVGIICSRECLSDVPSALCSDGMKNQTCNVTCTSHLFIPAEV